MAVLTFVHFDASMDEWQSCTVEVVGPNSGPWWTVRDDEGREWLEFAGRC